jgi:hypothetical protein
MVAGAFSPSSVGSSLLQLPKTGHLFRGEGVPQKCVFHSASMARESLQKLATFIEEGKMKLVVRVYDMEQVQQVRYA